jgi:hypothetical protein
MKAPLLRRTKRDPTPLERPCIPEGLRAREIRGTSSVCVNAAPPVLRNIFASELRT